MTYSTPLKSAVASLAAAVLLGTSVFYFGRAAAQEDTPPAQPAAQPADLTASTTPQYLASMTTAEQSQYAQSVEIIAHLKRIEALLTYLANKP